MPRWLVLGPGLFVGASLTAYFGVAGMTAWINGDIGGPFLPLLLEMGGYTLWGGRAAGGLRVVRRAHAAAMSETDRRTDLMGSALPVRRVLPLASRVLV